MRIFHSFTDPSSHFVFAYSHIGLCYSQLELEMVYLADAMFYFFVFRFNHVQDWSVYIVYSNLISLVPYCMQDSIRLKSQLTAERKLNPASFW